MVAPRCRSSIISLALLAACLGRAPAEVIRGPYVQSLLADSVEILWVGDEPAAGAVRWTAIDPPGGTRIVAEDGAGTRHQVRIDGLSPGSVYRYEIFEDDAPVAVGPELVVRTPPPPGSGTWRGVALGDSGDLHYEEQRNQHAVTAVIEAFEPDLFLHTGDYVYTGTIDEVFFIEYRRLLRSIGVFAARGNHDGITPAEWFDLFSAPPLPSEIAACDLPPGICLEDPPSPPPPLVPRAAVFYSFDWGPAHFAVLDSILDFTGCGAQMRWLCADLEAASSRSMPWLIILLHEPPYTAGLHGPAASDRVPRFTQAHALIPPITEKFGVDLVISGHDHNYQRSYPISRDRVVDGWQDPDFASPRAPIYVVTGAGGTRMYPERPGALQRSFLRVFEQRYHAVEIEASESTLELRAATPEGDVLDAFTIRKDEGPHAPGFRRGDANFDGAVHLSDAVAILGRLFLGEETPCPPGFALGADVNGSRTVDIADAIYLLGYLFLGGPAPPPPFARCESVPGLDDSGCLVAACRV